MYRILVFLLLFNGWSQLNGQTIDELVKRRKAVTSALDKADLSHQIADKLLLEHDTAAMKYANEALAYSSKIKDKEKRQEAKLFCVEVLMKFQRFEAANKILDDLFNHQGQQLDSARISTAYLLRGELQQKTADYQRSTLSLKQAILFSKGNQRTEAAALNRLGVTSRYQGNYQDALKHYLVALNIAKNINDTSLWAETLNNIGVLYKSEKKYLKASRYYKESLSLRKSVGDSSGVAKLYNNLGVIHKSFKEYDRAMTYYRKAMDIWSVINDQRNLSFTLNNIGVIYLDQKQDEEARAYFLRSLKIKERINDGMGMVITHINIGETYYNEKSYLAAEQNYKEALAISKRIGAKRHITSIYKQLADLYIEKGNYEKAVLYLKAFNEISDSLRMAEGAQSMEEVQARYQYKQSLYADSLKLLEERRSRDFVLKEKEWQLSTTRTFTIVFFVISLLIGLLAIALYSRFKTIKKSEETIAVKNEELKRTLISKEEKEVLLKEIHHRVKNNLQIISSLLRLQSATVDDDALLALYQEMQDRIMSMALVHMQLYRSDNFSTIEVPPYFDSLVDKLVTSYQFDKKIEVVKKIEVQKLGIDHLIPIGLIVNELVTNSLKHAFTGLPSGTITINFFVDKNQLYHLQVIDDGMGLGGTDQLDDYDSMGLDLIKTLVTQLEGEIKFTNRNGLRVDVTFSEERGI